MSILDAPALPALPPIGLRESKYQQLVHDADAAGDIHAHEAYKVAQYITLALQPKRRWDEKLKFFRHALHRHCNGPEIAALPVRAFYQDLVRLVRDHCGAEALRLASTEDDVYAKRLSHGASREAIAEDATKFFGRLLGHELQCPDCFHEEDWQALLVFRNQWV